MFRSNLRFVPWRNRKEWETVYRNAFSDDPELVRVACEMMEIWLCLRSDTAPAIECTYSLIQVLQKDKEPNGSNDWNSIGLMFSAAILRVVNLIADTNRQGMKESLYRVAKEVQIPDWIINLRHDIAHGGALPDASSLRMAAKYLLQWIKTYYWEVENEEYRDVVIEESREELFEKNLNHLINAYVQARLSPDDDSQFDFDELENHSFQSAWNKVNPWLAGPKVKSPKSQQTLTNEILRYLMNYFEPPANIGYDPYTVLLPLIFAHYEEYNSFEQEIWSALVVCFNKNQLLGKLLLALCESDVSVARDAWISTIIKAIKCRQLVDAKKEVLMESTVFQDGPEAKMAGVKMLRRRLNLDPNSSEDEVISELYRRLTKKRSQFYGVLMLSSPVDYLEEDCVFASAIQALSAKPYPDIYPLLNQLFPLVKPRLSEKVEKRLKSLIGLMLGERGFRELVSKKIYTLFDVEISKQNSSASANPAPKRIKGSDQPSSTSSTAKPFFRCSLPTNLWLENCDDLKIQPCESPQPASLVFPIS